MFSLKEKLNIICGHYGSGKTNIAVNMALSHRAAHPTEPVRIADLDIVNPYFRTADARELLVSKGIEVLLPEFANSNVDIPALPPKLVDSFSSDCHSIIDVGGDDGAVVLGMYNSIVRNRSYDMYYVVNMYRPLTASPEDALECMREIEDSCGLKCTALINNSSIGLETKAEDIIASVEYGKKCSELCEIPLVCHSYMPSAVPNLGEKMKEAGYGGEILFPLVNATKKLF